MLVDKTAAETMAMHYAQTMATEVAAEIGFEKPMLQWSEEQFNNLIESAVAAYIDRLQGLTVEHAVDRPPF